MLNITTYGFFLFVGPVLRLSDQTIDHIQKVKNTLAAVQPLLRGLFAAEFRGHWPMYRIGIILLADLALDMGLKKYGQRILDQVMPQV